MGSIIASRPTLEISDDSLNDGLLYRFLATREHLKNHRWFALDQSNRRLKDGDDQLVGYAYTGVDAYSGSNYHPFTADGVSAPFGSANSVPGFSANLNNWRINNADGAMEHGVGTGDFTICVTIKPNTIASAYYPIWANGSFAPAFYPCMSGAGGAWGMYWGSNITASSVLVVNQWWHLVATRRNGVIYFYKNGRPDGSVANTTSMANADHYIGSNGGTAYFRGRIGEVAFYNRGLASSEAKALHDDWRRGYRRILYWDSIARQKPTPVVGGTAVGTATGTSTATGVGASTATSVGSSTGAATATATGASSATSVGSSTGSATASAVGAATFNSVGSSTGAATATAVGAATTSSVGSSTGAATAAAVGSSIAASVGSSTGVSTATGVAEGGATAVGSSTGVATANAVGASIAASVGSSTGTSTATAVGTSAGGSTATGTATGSATASAVGASTVAAVGSSTGAATATAIGSAIASSVGSSTGSSTAAAIALLAGAAIGAANGFATANAVGASVWLATGTSSGTSTATGISPVTTAGFIRIRSASLSVPRATGTLSVPRATGTIQT